MNTTIDEQSLNHTNIYSRNSIINIKRMNRKNFVWMEILKGLGYHGERLHINKSFADFLFVKKKNIIQYN